MPTKKVQVKTHCHDMIPIDMEIPKKITREFQKFLELVSKPRKFDGNHESQKDESLARKRAEEAIRLFATAEMQRPQKILRANGKDTFQIRTDTLQPVIFRINALRELKKQISEWNYYFVIAQDNSNSVFLWNIGLDLGFNHTITNDELRFRKSYVMTNIEHFPEEEFTVTDSMEILLPEIVERWDALTVRTLEVLVGGMPEKNPLSKTEEKTHTSLNSQPSYV